MKKSFLTILTMSTLAVTALVGCGTSNNTTNSGGTGNNTSTTSNSGSGSKTSAIGIAPTVDPNATPGAGKVVVETDNTYPPMEYMDPNNPNKMIGFDVDLGDALAKYIHKDIVWKPTPWDGIVGGMSSNRYDAIISSMNDTPDREKNANFVDYVNFGQVIIVKAGTNSAVKTVDDLKGKTVGVQISTTSEDALKKAGGINIKEYNTFPDAFQDLANNRLDAVVVDECVGLYYLNLHPGQYQVAGQPFGSEPMGIAVRKDETQLYQDIKKALDQMKADGTYDKIYSYWFGSK